MQIKEKHKQEIEEKARGMSDFLRMEYLEKCLRENFSFDIKRFCNFELANIYNQRKMFSEAARKMTAIGEISVTFREKKQSYMKAAEFYIKAGLYDGAETSLKKAQENGNDAERKEMKNAIKILLKEQAEVYEKENRKAKAVEVYNWLYRLSEELEKAEIKKKLAELYLKLGRTSEYNILKGD